MTTCFLGPTLAKSSVSPQLTHAHGLTEHLRAGRLTGHTDQWTHMQGRCPGITFSTLKVPSHSPGRTWVLHMVSLDAQRMAGWFSALWESSSCSTDTWCNPDTADVSASVPHASELRPHTCTRATESLRFLHTCTWQGVTSHHSASPHITTELMGILTEGVPWEYSWEILRVFPQRIMEILTVGIHRK